MKKNLQQLVVVFSLALLVLAVGAAAAGQANNDDDKLKMKTTLTGQLSKNTDGDFLLVEQESGDQVLLKGSEQQLEEHVGHAVTVTGKWDKEVGKDCFRVSSVERATTPP